MSNPVPRNMELSSFKMFQLILLSAIFCLCDSINVPGVCQGPPPPPNIFFKTAKSLPAHRYPMKAIRSELFRNKEVHRDVIKYRQVARTEKWAQKKRDEQPPLPGPVIPTYGGGELLETCPTRYTTLILKPKVWYRNNWCWLLRPWWGLKWKYASCKTRECKGINPMREIPVTPRYFCRPERYIAHRYVLFCSHLKPRIQVRYIRLPQCCDCYKWQCFVKGK